MIILFSPTKQMDFNYPLSPELMGMAEDWSAPVFRDRALALNSVLEGLDREELRTLMKISPALAEKTERMISSFRSARERPAVSAYSGTSFKSLDVFTLDTGALLFARKHLRILSGMYGLLGPLDMIAPYRMEMKTPLNLQGAASLTAFWKPLVGRILEGEDFVLNLASAEYSRVLSLPKGRVVDVHFKEEQGEKLRTVGMYAKQARGLMLRQILEKRCAEPDALRALIPDGYSFRAGLSSDKSWVFTRPCTGE